MSDWCSNTLTITGGKEMLDEVRDFLDVREGRYASPFCFDRVLPYPEPFRTMDAERAEGKLKLGKDGYNRGGHEWRVDNWGTDRSLGDNVSLEAGDGCLCYAFRTLSSPIPVIDRLAALFPELDLSLHFEEEGGFFAGDREYSGGVLTGKTGYEPESDEGEKERIGAEGADEDAQELCKAAKEGDITAVKRLLEAGADVDARNRFSGSPLYYACWHGHADIVRLLLQHGADTCQRDAGGFTPLHWACVHEGVEILKLILEYGKDRVDVNAMTGYEYGCTIRYGQTALHLAGENVNVDAVRTLLEAGADMGIVNFYGCSPVFNVIRANDLRPWNRDAAERIVNLFIEHSPKAVFEEIIALPDEFTGTRERVLEWYRENKPDIYFEKWCQTPMAPGRW